MIDENEPIKLDDYRRAQAARTGPSTLVDESTRGRVEPSRLGLAIASVVDQRRWQDWAWLDQDRALHQP
jgi:hypothetical protein